MRIYIKTPLINNSKMIPHLVEHCTWHSTLNLNDYFDLSYWADGVINTDYTYFEFDKRIDYKYAIEKLNQPIAKESFLYEKEMIKQELEDVSYDQRIYEWVVKKYLDSDFSMNKFEEVSREDVKNYHEKYYTSENMIVIDESDFKILKQWFQTSKTKKQNQTIKKYPFIFEDDKYLVYIWKKTDWTWYREMYFFFRMICFFSAYLQRWQKWEYYYLEPYFYEYEDNCIIIIWDYDYSQLNEKFFEWWKKYILDMFKAWYFEEKFFLNEYFYWIWKSREDVINLYKKYSYSDFTEIINL